MANRLADLNRSKRDYAYSGKAGVGDIPWLYSLQAQQAAANQPAGIGQGGGNAMAEGAPNPLAPGGAGGGGSGGASGGADTGLPGPGQTGMGDEFDQFYRDYVAEGGQAGENFRGGLYGEGGYVDPTLAEIVGYLGPGPIGLVGTLGAMGMRGYNADLLDTELQNAGFSGLTTMQGIGAALGRNQYGAGDPRDTWGAQGIGGLAEAAYEAQTNAGVYDSLNDPALGVSANQRARSDTRGGAETAGSAYDRALGASASARHSERGGGAGEGGGGGTRDREGRSSADRHGAGNYHDGGYVSEDNNPDQLRGDVQTTLQEGEGVLTADALDVLGPGFVYGVNMMAKMMRTRR